MNTYPMNRPYAEITMYSGMCHLDPRIEITEEQSIVIEEKLQQLKEPFIGKKYYGTGVLSSTSYMVLFPENIGVYVHDNGYVHIVTEIYNPDDTGFQDTVGLHEYLKELLNPALEQHQEDMKKMWEDYNKKISTPEGLEEYREEVLRVLK